MNNETEAQCFPSQKLNGVSGRDEDVDVRLISLMHH